MAGQTGNIVFLAVDIASKGACAYRNALFTLFFFILGIFYYQLSRLKLDSPYVKPLSVAPLHLGLSSDRVLTCQYT